ncbi:hypothetical protein [Chryseobacterium sp.]|uniref:hypothetical protein n=1 Tax=Chryseobacterium sp. TaxID=1871047 RepID=UPI0011C90EF1|nr:hypothetical protein [Chryseobacterium sp.]TXF77767.1 hypothetical protein FUA25_07545 [Chryseobacterium sp.]
MEKEVEIEKLKRFIEDQLQFEKMSVLSAAGYRKFVWEFFTILDAYKNQGTEKEDIVDTVNTLHTAQSIFFTGDPQSEDRFGFITEELINFCPSPFFWEVPLDEYMKKWERLYFPLF